LLSVLKIDLNWTKANYGKGEEAIKKIYSMIDIVNDTIKSVQRISSDLRPGILDDLGLIPAMEWFCQEFEKRTGIKCHLNLGDFESTNEKKNLALYRILQEATTNVMRHANAKNLYVKCIRGEDSVFLEIMDDGTGMKQEKIDSSKSLGLIGMRERIKQFDGRLDIKSTMHVGTTISVYVPIN
jgi:signal transduction histidine kinase